MNTNPTNKRSYGKYSRYKFTPPRCRQYQHSSTSRRQYKSTPPRHRNDHATLTRQIKIKTPGMSVESQSSSTNSNNEQMLNIPKYSQVVASNVTNVNKSLSISPQKSDKEINDSSNNSSVFESPIKVGNASKYSHSPSSLTIASFSSPIDFRIGTDVDHKAESAEPDIFSLKIESQWDEINEEFETPDRPSITATHSNCLDNALSASMDYYLTDSASPHPHLLLQESEDDQNEHGTCNQDKDTKFDFSDIVISTGTVSKSNVVTHCAPAVPPTPALPQAPPQTCHNLKPMVGIPHIQMYNNVNINMNPNMNVNMNVNFDINNNNNNKISNQRMGVRKLVQLVTKKKLSMQQLVEGDLIRTLIFDQNGARYIQSLLTKRYKRNDKYSDIVSLLVEHLVNLHINNRLNLTNLACHEYGNYAISLIFELCTTLELKLLLDTFLYESVVTVSGSYFGSRVMIKILDILFVKKKDAVFQLIKNFKKRTTKNCQNNDFSLYLRNINESASMVIQKMLDLKLPYATIKFIGDALNEKLAQFCGTIYGSRIVQKYISSYGSKLNILQLFDDNDSYFTLSKAVYGNYTMQKIIKRNQCYSNLLEYSKFRNKFIRHIFGDGDKLVELSVNKHGSALIETCISVATRQQINKFIDTACKDRASVLSKILHGEFGNFVAKTLLRTCVDYESERRRIINAVNQHVIDLNEYGYYGHSQLKSIKLEKCALFIKECYEWYNYY